MTGQQNKDPRVLVVGCGGIGGVLACRLLLADTDVSIATSNGAVRAMWVGTGPQLDGRPLGRALSPEKVLNTAQDASGTFDLVFIAVQPTELESVAESLSGKLATNAKIVCLPNGLCERRLGEILGPERIVGAVVLWGARMPTPGHYVQTSKGGFLVGTLLQGTLDSSRARGSEEEPGSEKEQGSAEEASVGLEVVTRLLQTTGPVRRTENLRGARFSKLTINCAITALGTIGGGTLGALLMRADARNLALQIMREAATVAQADGVHLEPVANINLEKLALGARDKKLTSATRHALLLALGARYRRLRSSMLSSIERGKTPAIDYINGEIVKLGRERGVATPFNLAATEVIWAIHRGELRPGADALKAVSTRAARTVGPVPA